VARPSIEESIPFTDMRIVFRADASSVIGSGHVMRLSAIAEAATIRGYETIFIGEIRDLGWVKTYISNIGFNSLFETELEFTANSESDVLILDSYLIPIHSKFIQPENWLKVITIIDSQTPDYRSTLKIHPGLSKDWYLGSSHNFLYGKKYIPLRRSITKQKYENDSRDAGLLRVIITGGGSDPFDFSKSIAKEILRIPGNYKFIFISNDEAIEDLDERFSVTLIGGIKEEDFQSVDLAFTTASTSSLEFIAREIPCGIACAVDNQQIYYQSIEKYGLAVCIGTRMKTDEWGFDVMAIAQLLNSSSTRERLKKKCFEYIDLNGASRIVDVIIN